MQPISISPASHAANGTAAPPPKLLRAAQQFEALLLNDLLGPVEKTFASVPGKENSAGSGTYEYLGTQALASNLAASGGLGIAAKIVRNLMQHQSLTSTSTAAIQAKVLPSKSR
jgi:peptidoglycan hydrolase FlgJ